MESFRKSIPGNGISGSTLKLIAIAAMLIDHIGLALCDNMRLMRIVGRIAFPIFAFMLVEGFYYTHNRRKYVLRLAMFALLSEIPFNMLVTGSVFDTRMLNQNVIFTMLIAFVTMWALDWAKGVSGNYLRYVLCVFVITGAGMAAAELGRTDYGAVGVLTIVVMYLLHYNRAGQILFSCLVLGSSGSLEIYCLLAAIPLLFYNGRKGLALKYVFYVFYPLHMLMITLLRLYCFQF